MKNWILAATTIMMAYSADAITQQWSPPSCCRRSCVKPAKPPAPVILPQPACPSPCLPKVTCPPDRPCPKPICAPKPCCPPDRPCPKPFCPPKPCCPPVCYEHSLEMDPCCSIPAYSVPARVFICNGQDLRFSASFIYWQPMQGGMELGIPAEAVTTFPTLGLRPASVSGASVLVQDFDYKPGFKVGAAWFGAKDNWIISGEYTWLHGTSETEATTPPAPGIASINGLAVPGIGVWFPTSWLATNFFTNNATNTISSEWKYDLDFIDLQISRPYYSGTRFTVEPFFGTRVALIDQTMTITAGNIPTTVAVPSPSRTAIYDSDSWGVGPRVGMNGSWLMGLGIRFIGNAAGSLLYTQYTSVTENVESPDVNALPINVKLEDFNCLRPNLDLSFGLGWGHYFKCRRIFFDFAATYDFSIFWEQNMMRYLADQVQSFSNSDGAASNLYLQGLTLRWQLSF